MTSSHWSGLTYRPDIDGLRAIAVLAVVFYHFGVGGFQGGYVGVDVFFVISGYLITGIVARDIERGQFSFGRFYERRIRRIFPALFLVLILTMSIGTWLLLPSDLAALGKRTAATIAFVSNIQFWRSSGYFDQASELNPLLHTWSLAVEEQFYLVAPSLLILLSRLSEGNQRRAVLAFTLGSFSLCALLLDSRPAAVFFLAPFRAWELSLGCMLALGMLPRLKWRFSRELLAVLGIALLTYSVFAYSRHTPFPGAHALVPTLGTLLILYAGEQQSTMVSRGLSARPLVYVGLVSYSFYLWHWPALMYSRYARGMEPLGRLTLPLLLLVFLLASLSYHAVETPFRRKSQPGGRRRLFTIASAVASTIFLIGLGLWFARGIPGRFDPIVLRLDAERTPSIPFLSCHDLPATEVSTSHYCLVGTKSGAAPSALIWGDSHALAWLPAIDSVLKSRGQSAWYAGRSACPPLLGLGVEQNPFCSANNKFVFAFLRSSPTIKSVLLVAAWGSYSGAASEYALFDDQGRRGNERVFAAGLSESVRALNQAGKTVILLGPVAGAPTEPVLRMAIAARFERPLPLGLPASSYELANHLFVALANSAQQAGILRFIDVQSWFCPVASCIYSTNGQPLYRDEGHLNVRGALYFEPGLEREWRGL